MKGNTTLTLLAMAATSNLSCILLIPEIYMLNKLHLACAMIDGDLNWKKKII